MYEQRQTRSDNRNGTELLLSAELDRLLFIRLNKFQLYNL